MKSIITKQVKVPFRMIGQNIENLLLNEISNKIGGKCITEGYVKPDSIGLISYSSGNIEGEYVSFEIVIELLICRPVEGMRFKCIAKNITKAGIRAETNATNSPVVIFIARDHYYQNKYFNSIKENDKIMIRVIGIRYELNDTYISIIADLVNPKPKTKQKITLT